jgi:hypothetical protein
VRSTRNAIAILALAILALAALALAAFPSPVRPAARL